MDDGPLRRASTIRRAKVHSMVSKAYDRVTLQKVSVGRASTLPSPVKAYLRCAVSRMVRFRGRGRATPEFVHLHDGLPQRCSANPVLVTVVVDNNSLGM